MWRTRVKRLNGGSPGKEIDEKWRGVRDLPEWKAMRFHRSHPGQRLFIQGWTKAVMNWSTTLTFYSSAIVPGSVVIQMSEFRCQKRRQDAKGVSGADRGRGRKGVHPPGLNRPYYCCCCCCCC